MNVGKTVSPDLSVASLFKQAKTVKPSHSVNLESESQNSPRLGPSESVQDIPFANKRRPPLISRHIEKDLDARTRVALSAYLNEQNQPQKEEETLISKMLGVDFYV